MVWMPIDNFSSEQQKRCITKFKARALLLLNTVSKGLEFNALLEESKISFTREELDQLYSERNLPATRYFLSRALGELERKKIIYFKGINFIYGAKPEA